MSTLLVCVNVTNVFHVVTATGNAKKVFFEQPVAELTQLYQILLPQRGYCLLELI